MISKYINSSVLPHHIQLLLQNLLQIQGLPKLVDFVNVHYDQLVPSQNKAQISKTGLVLGIKRPEVEVVVSIHFNNDLLVGQIEIAGPAQGSFILFDI